MDAYTWLTFCPVCVYVSLSPRPPMYVYTHTVVLFFYTCIKPLLSWSFLPNGRALSWYNVPGESKEWVGKPSVNLKKNKNMQPPLLEPPLLALE